jgi:hypothetical protein
MTKEELIKKLLKIAFEGSDEEHDHVEADDLLIEYINDSDIKEAYEAIIKWYA